MSGVEHTEQLLQEMEKAGLKPGAIQQDGKIQRCPTISHPNKKNGWYVYFPDALSVACYGNWEEYSKYTWHADIGRELTKEELQRIEEKKREAEELKEQAYAEAAKKARKEWVAAEPAQNHPYLKKKQIKPHIARSKNEILLLPVYNENEEIQSLQRIEEKQDGTTEKLNYTNGKMKGGYCILGELANPGKAFLAEGYATAASIHEATRIPTIVAYTVGNLKQISELFKRKHPQLEQIIVADNDENGAGEKGARAAAAETGAKVILIPEPGMDANDYAVAGKDLKGLLLKEEIRLDQEILQNLSIIFGDSLSEKFVPPDELIEGILCLDSTTMIYGESNSGKTFFALEMARAVSTGNPFFERKVDQGIVLYIAAESPGSIRSRLQAIKRFHNIALENIAVIQRPVNFYNEGKNTEEIISAINAIERKKRKKVKLIIGDTLARISAGANENSGEDMGIVMARFDELKYRTGAAVVVIHHSGKDAAKGARGWSGIRGHIDTEIEITEKESSSDSVRVAEITKQRELGTKGYTINFDLSVIEMGLGKFGNRISTCVVIPTTKAPREKDKTLTGYIQLMEESWKNSNKEIREYQGNRQPFIKYKEFAEYLCKTQYKKGTKEKLEYNAAYQRVKPNAENMAKKLMDSGVLLQKESEKGYLIMGQPGDILMMEYNQEEKKL